MIDKNFYESWLEEEDSKELSDSRNFHEFEIAQIFPYDQYKDSQAIIISSILELPPNGKIMIEAETGSGKTIATLSALLARKKPDQIIIIFVKTINQFNAILREWQRIENKIKSQNEVISQTPKFLIISLLGKKRICFDEFQSTNKTIIPCTGDTKVHPKKFEKLISKNKRSRLLRGINRKLLTTNATITEFTKLLQEKENCPYYNSRSMLQDADIVVTTYPFLKPKLFNKLLKQMNINVTNSLILIDEAHNLAFSHPIELTKIQFDVFLNFFGSNKLFEVLKNEFRGVRILDIGKLISPQVLDFERKQILDLISIFTKKKMLIQLSNENKFDSELREIIKESIRAMKSFIENLGREDLIITKEYVKIVNLYIDQTLTDQKNANILVLQSATLTPLDAFRNLLGMPSDTKLLDRIERDIRVIRKNPQQFRASYVSAVSSEARFRNNELYERYAGLIVRLQKVVPRHTLVLAPSYNFIENLEKAILIILRDDKSPEDTQDLEIICETALSTQKHLYDDVINLKSNGIILGNQNGKILEGNEWVVDGKSIVNMVIFAGISSMVPQEEVNLINRIREKVIHDRSISRLFQNQIPLYIQAKQAMGRIIRGINDNGALIILDHRANDFLHQNLWLHRYTRMDDLIEDIAEFYD
ncbi:MAG: ATP-dependent DNA helicase [Candidatus Heimdallarchaeota archaeon LC_2]|nr:MAG: ATP-dependent DNA helicase [Candidatus Heimdallarchaeota archaeon LC_2]